MRRHFILFIGKSSSMEAGRKEGNYVDDSQLWVEGYSKASAK
jgi:hypothetical protein